MVEMQPHEIAMKAKPVYTIAWNNHVQLAYGPWESKYAAHSISAGAADRHALKGKI